MVDNKKLGWNFFLLTGAHNANPKQLNFEHGFRPIYYFSRAVGLWPFSFRQNSNGTIQNAYINRLDGVWFLMSLSIQLWAIFRYYTYLVDLEDEHTNCKSVFTFSILYALFRMKSLLIGAVGIVLDLHNRHKLANILKKFIIFDSKVGSNSGCSQCYLRMFYSNLFTYLFIQMAKLKIEFNFKRDHRCALLNLITPTISAVALTMIAIATFDVYLSKSVITLLVLNYIDLRSLIWIPIVISFSSFERGLCQRFDVLNSLLRFMHITFQYILIDMTSEFLFRFSVVEIDL